MTFLETWSPAQTSTLLALVATLGYIVGRLRYRREMANRAKSRQEIMRARAVARELENIGHQLQKALESHIPAVNKFSSQLSRLEQKPEVSWHELCDRADEMLKPILRLSSQISQAYSELLQQTADLASFAELRTDPLTAVANRRAFDESLATYIARQTRYGEPLSLAILDIDFFKQVNDVHGHLQGDRVLQNLAALLRGAVRDCDMVARFGGEEFVLLMPQTELHAACSLTERIRGSVQQLLPITVSVGLAAAVEDDTPDNLIARADAALYQAKGAGRNCVCLHEGSSGRIVGIKSSADQSVSPVDEQSPRDTAEHDELAPSVSVPS